MKFPIISIIVPCFKQAEYLNDALNSVLNQTFKNWECIIVNDGSPDNTEKIGKSWETRDSRFLYLFKENGGLSSARNFGIQKASGKYILPLDADDFFEPEFCKMALDLINQQDNDYKIITCKANLIYENGRIGSHKPLGGTLKNFLFSNSAIGNSLFKKVDWEGIGGYDEKMLKGYEDWEFYIRLLLNSGEAYVLDKPLFNYRIKNQSMRKDANAIKYDLWKYIFTKHKDIYVQYYGDLLEFFLQKLKREEMEKIKHTKRLEFRIGKAILHPLRKFKKKFISSKN